MSFREKFPSFPNYTEAMYEGNEPASKKCDYPDNMFNGKCSLMQWTTKFGEAHTFNDEELLHCNINIGTNVRLYIVGDYLQVVQIMAGGTARVYCNKDYTYFDKIKILGVKEVEMEKQKAVEFVTRCKLTCKLWKIIKSRFFELIGDD